MEVGNQKHFDVGSRGKEYCSLSAAMGFILTISGCNKWDLLLGFMICSGLLIFADGYTAIEAIEDLSDFDDHHHSSDTSRSGSGLLQQAQQMCRLYSRGTFQVAPCIWCECTQEGNTKCWAQTCSSQEADPECIKYETLDGECCPICVEYGCKYNGTSYKRGSSIVTHDACKKCYCPWEGESRGEAVCLDLHCPPLNCVDPHKPAAKCCPVCPNGKVFYQLNGRY